MQPPVRRIPLDCTVQNGETVRNGGASAADFQVRKSALRPARDAAVQNGAVYSTIPLFCAQIEPESGERKRNFFGHPVPSICTENRPALDGGRGLCAGDCIPPLPCITCGQG